MIARKEHPIVKGDAAFPEPKYVGLSLAVSEALRTVIYRRRVRKAAAAPDQLLHSCHKNCSRLITLPVHLALEIRFSKLHWTSCANTKIVSSIFLNIALDFDTILQLGDAVLAPSSGTIV